MLIHHYYTKKIDFKKLKQKEALGKLTTAFFNSFAEENSNNPEFNITNPKFLSAWKDVGNVVSLLSKDEEFTLDELYVLANFFHGPYMGEYFGNDITSTHFTDNTRDLSTLSVLLLGRNWMNCCYFLLQKN